jgi:general secretion pathway protein I
MTSQRRHSYRMRVRAGFNVHRANRGFTLLELLLAFLVFSLSFATILEIMSGSMRNTVRARENTEAALTAQSVMDQLGLGIPLEAGFAANGESGDYNWDIEIYPYDDQQGQNAHTVELAELTGIQLLQIDLEVRWGEPPRAHSSHFSTVRAIIANQDGAR